MARVIIECENFTGNYSKINGQTCDYISRLKILLASIVLGAQKSSDLRKFGWGKLLYRFGIGLSLSSLLEIQEKRGVQISVQYSELDRTEKAINSYWAGMIMAKLVADLKLGIPWLAHADLMKKRGCLTITSGSKRIGDLVGRGKNGDWHVIEAKGRSNTPEPSLVEDAKKQAGSIKIIRNKGEKKGKHPATASACITSLHANPISVLLVDPPPDEENGVHWEIDKGGFFELYYCGIIEYLNRYRGSSSIDRSAFITAPLFLDTSSRLPEIEIGLLKSIFENPEQADTLVTDMPNQGESTNTTIIGSDGIAIFGPNEG